jgi:D-glycero-D-manno-heptose 1,7-bisphosphate phosphatase
MQKAIFLDRDGVIIHNRSFYVRTWNDVKIYPYSFAAIALLAKLPHKIFMLTNQSAIGRGLVDIQTAIQINERLVMEIQANGGRIDRVYVCPHAPGELCTCRKPNPGLIFQAKADFDLDLKDSWLVGDALSDLQAGLNGGVKNLMLVQTGRGKKQSLKFRSELEAIDFQISKNILESAKSIWQSSNSLSN